MLRATKVTASSLGRAMSTLVVQECHIWLSLADMRDTDKVRFLNASVSQTGLFGDAVENLAQQVLAAQKQTEAIRHILPRRPAAASTLPTAAVPQPAHCRGQSPATATAHASHLQQPPSGAMELGAGRLPLPSWPPSNMAVSRRARGPGTGDPEKGSCFLGDGEGTSPSPGGGPGGESGNLDRRAVFSLSGSQEGTEICGRPNTGPHSSSSFARWQQRAVRERQQRPYSRQPVEPGEPCTPHSHHTPACSQAARVGSLCSTSLSHCGYGCGYTGPACTVLKRLVSATQPVSLLQTISLGYVIQITRHPPKLCGVRFTTVKAYDAPVLREEIAVLLAKDAIEPVSPADMRTGFYSLYFIVPKKGGGLRPILDLRVLNRALHRLLFKMLTLKRIFRCVRPQDCFAAIDLKDVYFHVSILPCHRPFLQFAFEGLAYQYKVPPFGLSRPPRVFTKVTEAALVPLREQSVRILNYSDDWLILAQSRDQLCKHRDVVLRHLSLLGLQVSWEKSKLSPW